MAKDSDVARVAAAMNAPGFRYRSFGNEPVRIRPGQAGTLAEPVSMPEPFVPESFAAEPFAPEAYAAAPYAPEPYAPEPYVTAAYSPEQTAEAAPAMPAPEALLAGYDALPEHFDLSQQAGFRMATAPVAMEPPPAPAPVVEPMPVLDVAPMPAPLAATPPPEPPAVPLFSWPEAPLPPPAAPVSLLPEVARAYAPNQSYTPAEPATLRPGAGGGFRLLEAIGHRSEDSGAPRAPEVTSGTLGMLRSAIAAGPGDSTMASIAAGAGATNQGFAPVNGLSAGHTGNAMAGLLPAASVTVPLSDVMRLIAAGATPPPSPFDAFRVALGAQPGR